MDKEILHQILAVQESALSDYQYMQLHKNYLLASVPLHHRLMYLAICYGRSK